MTTNNNILLTGKERDAYIAKRFPNKLTGQALLDYVHENPLKSHTERCKGAGYFKYLEDGSKGCNFVEYFESILDARKANCEDDQIKVSSADWYESLTEQDSELYDMIEDMCPEFSKLDAEQCQEFMDELSKNGITTGGQFESAYFWQTNSYKAEADFSEYVSTEIFRVDIPAYVFNHIDWQSMWDCELRHDFFTIEFDGESYFFSSNF